MSWAKHLALIGQGRIAYIVLVKKKKRQRRRKDQLQYLGIDGRILKWAIMKLIGSFCSSKHVNENSSSIKCSEFLD